jgi:hypothetical protein
VQNWEALFDTRLLLRFAGSTEANFLLLAFGLVVLQLPS